jgi:CSLREA domain-containing protein
MRFLRIPLTVILLIIILLPARVGEAGGSGWWVNTTDDLDDGLCDNAHCSLREAIIASNTTPGQQIIAFEIPGIAPYTIEICSPLPAITDAVLIDGTLEAAYPYNGGPVVALAPGQNCAAPPYALWFEVGNNVVRGLSIVGFDQASAPISGGLILHAGVGSTIEDNYIGLLPGGTPWGNRNGILLGSESHTIENNVISGNTYGVHAFMGGHIIDQNYIGTDPGGTSTSLDLRNTIGVYIEPGADNNDIGLSGTGNVISGNGDGVYLGSQSNTLLGNKIGTDHTGTIALGNGNGVHASVGTHNSIGGTVPGDSNLISGNITGLKMGSNSHVWGNFIGTDFSGSAAIPNQIGIGIQTASYVLIGGTGAGQSNLISGNSNAGIIIHGGASHVEVVRNKIGTDITGSGPLGNGRGIFIQGSDNFIGHVATGGGNTIAYNNNEGILIVWSAAHNRIEVNDIHDNGVGVYAMDDTTNANPFTQNTIFANAALGLDLAPWGVNLNDPGDGDTGANQRLNYPEFTSASTSVAEGTACHGCTVEIFQSDLDSSNHGEGEVLLGSVVAGPFGDFTFNYPSTLATCDRITATTTDVFGNTSEFSPNRAVGLCMTLDPSDFFLVEITIFIIIWFAIFIVRRRRGRPVGGAAAAGGAAGLMAALVMGGAMVALPFIEVGLPWVMPEEEETPLLLPACESFLAPSSMHVMDAFMPPEPLGDDGQHGDGMTDPLADDGQHNMPVDPYDRFFLSWDPSESNAMPVDPLADDGEHGMPVVWLVDLVGPSGMATRRLTNGNVIPLSSFMLSGEGLMVEDKDYDTQGASQEGLMVDSQDYDTQGASQEGLMVNDHDWDLEGAQQDGLMIDEQDWDLVGVLQEGLMVDDQDYQVQPFYWRLTGLARSGDGALLPFCESTHWVAFRLGGTSPIPLLPWTDSAPPPSEPPSPPQPVVILPEEEPEECEPTFTANMNLTCRYGPDSLYKELGYLLQGESALIEGRNADSTWWYIPNPDWQGSCWVWDGGGQAICISEDIPVRRAPPLPPTETPIICSRDMGRDACEAAGGTYMESRTSAESYCDCP